LHIFLNVGRKKPVSWYAPSLKPKFHQVRKIGISVDSAQSTTTTATNEYTDGRCSVVYPAGDKKIQYHNVCVSASLHRLPPISNSKILWSSGYDSRLGSATAVDCERPPVRVRARSFFCRSFGLFNFPIGLVLGAGKQNEVLRGLRTF
jgi:hypothetical protein